MMLFGRTLGACICAPTSDLFRVEVRRHAENTEETMARPDGTFTSLSSDDEITKQGTATAYEMCRCRFVVLTWSHRRSPGQVMNVFRRIFI
jgi:hypothetical protein